MNTNQLKKFAQSARRQLIEQVGARLNLVLETDSAELREKSSAIAALKDSIAASSQKQVIDRVAYTWFNRFCALRFMDVNRYNRTGIVSPAEGYSQPEILQDAKQGVIATELTVDREKVLGLLGGQISSSDPQGEAYRLLVVAACNFLHRAMPFLFQRIDDYTELLMPDDLLLGNSILATTREAMTPDGCADVEVIGWLYQFYISEKKDEVFDGLKKNKKITPENIPAATQLFTPHWIVRYLVENSLGRLWLLNRPGSKLVERMDYYIKPEQAETDFLRISKPEEIKICDPACGSGHMLTYAFDLLYAIYEEEGYESAEIPEKILTHNLYGIEIDERAGELAAFALTMKARAKQRRFFNKGIKPNICILGNVHFDEGELENYMDFVGPDLFTAPLQTTLRQFEEADNFGSLIRPNVTDVDGMLRILESKNVSGQLFISMTHQKVLQALRQADYLCPKYHVVIANPPYMGGKGMNGRLGSWAKDNYPTSKADLFAMFIERGLELVPKYGYSSMVTMQSWMFLSSYESLRTRLMVQTSIESMAHMANMVMGIAFGTSATVWKLGGDSHTQGAYCYIGYEDIGADGKPVSFPPHNKRNGKAKENGGKFWVPIEEFKKIPGAPIAYWINENVRSSFQQHPDLFRYGETREGLTTGCNDLFLRLWHEVDRENIGLGFEDRESAKSSDLSWFPYNKGGDVVKWYGNTDYLVNWHNDGEVLQTRKHPSGRIWAHNFNLDYIFKESISWTAISNKGLGFRYFPNGFLFDANGLSFFPNESGNLLKLIATLNSRIGEYFAKVINSSMKFNAGDIGRIPINKSDRSDDEIAAKRAIAVTKSLWDSYETSWDFTSLPLLNPDNHQPTLKATYQKLRAHWRELTLEMQRLEEENNRIFIEAYGLQDELTPEVPINEITLACNPHYRYGNDKSEEGLEALLLADTMRELVSYAVGCMFGRYALDKPGLILANQGETIEDYLKRVPHPSFPADDDNVIPMLDGDWFNDDIAERFRKFLRVAFGDEHYEANLKFVEKALNIKGKRNYSIRDYFLSEFYTGHVKRYKKRPIYWLFSSPKGSFNALIYMHRYRPDTVSVVLNDYLREFRTKLNAIKEHLEKVSISGSASKTEKTRALKEIEKIKKTVDELNEYENEILYPLATEKIEIDLDDGVKVNYPKFGKALKKVAGLN